MTPSPYWWVFGKYPSHSRVNLPDGAFFQYIEWMGVIAYCDVNGNTLSILHCAN